MITAWTCTAIDATTSNCVVTASTTPETASSTPSVPYGDWLLVNGLIVFFLGFVVIANIGNIFRFK